MANGEFLDYTTDAAIKMLEKANGELQKTVNYYQQINAAKAGASTPSGSQNLQQGLAKNYQDQSKAIAELQAKLLQLSNAQKILSQGTITTATGQRVLIKTSGDLTKTTREQSVANQILRAEQDRNFRSNTMLAGAYARASAQLLILKKEAKDAAIAFGEESKQAINAAKAASELDGRIKKADASVGDYQRNVGNYTNSVAKGFSSLFSGVRQLAYILPGIGIAGILSLAIDPLFELIKGMDLFKARLNAGAAAAKDFRDANLSAQKSTVEELNTLRANLEIAKDVNLSYKERSIAVDNLNAQYPFYFENLTKEQILAGDTAVAEQKLTQAIIARAKANAIVAKITENESKVVDKEQERIDLENELTNAIISRNAATAFVNKADLQRGEGNANRAVQAIGNVEEIQKRLKRNQRELNELNAYSDRLTKGALVNQEKAIGLDYKATEAKKEKIKEIKREQTESANVLKPDQSFLQILQEQIKIFKEAQEQVSDTSEEYAGFQRVIDGLQRSILLITDPSKVIIGSTDLLVKQQANINKTKESIKELKKVMKDYLSSFEKDFFGSSGLPTLFDILDKKILAFGGDFKTTFVALAEVSQEFFNVFSQLSENRFASEKEGNERNYEIAKQLAGDNVKAKEDADIQYEKKRREIEARELKDKKNIAKINIAIDAAQAAVAAFKDGNIIKGVITAAAIAAIAAIQIGLINSQTVPQYFKGTDNAPGGLAWTNEKGAEIHTDKHGNIKDFGSKKGARLTMTEKGDKIYTAEKTKELMFNRELNGLLSDRGISNTPIVNINSLTAEQYMAGVARTEAAIANFSPIQISDDRRGKSIYQGVQKARVINMNNRLFIKGKINP